MPVDGKERTSRFLSPSLTGYSSVKERMSGRRFVSTFRTPIRLRFNCGRSVPKSPCFAMARIEVFLICPLERSVVPQTWACLRRPEEGTLFSRQVSGNCDRPSRRPVSDRTCYSAMTLHFKSSQHPESTRFKEPQRQRARANSHTALGDRVPAGSIRLEKRLHEQGGGNETCWALRCPRWRRRICGDF